MIRCFLRNACNYTTFEAAKIDSTLFRYMLYISKGTYDLVFTGNVTPNSIDCKGCHFSVLVVLFCKHSVLRSFCETCDEYTVIRTILTTVLRCKNQSHCHRLGSVSLHRQNERYQSVAEGPHNTQCCSSFLGETI